MGSSVKALVRLARLSTGDGHWHSTPTKEARQKFRGRLLAQRSWSNDHAIAVRLAEVTERDGPRVQSEGQVAPAPAIGSGPNYAGRTGHLGGWASQLIEKPSSRKIAAVSEWKAEE
jgi:hypothetical protein